MKVLIINAVYGIGSTGVIVKELLDCCSRNDIDGYVAYSLIGDGVDLPSRSYKIGNIMTRKWQALMSRVAGKQAYYNRISTKRFLKWVDKIKPDVVHLHNLHSNYIHLNMLLKYLAKNDIATVITMHDCWYFTGGCFHYTNVGCDKWQYGCGNCPKRLNDTPAYLYDSSASILKDREKYLSAIPRLTLVGCSEWVANEARKSVLKDCDIRYIHNGFDLDIFKPTPSNLKERLGINGKYVILGPASKWLSNANSDTLQYFIDNMPNDWVLVLFGCTNTNRHIADNVRLYGYTCSANEMAQLYSMADVFVNCSREDTLSSLNIEAQACGTPVVTYEATGSKETVDGKCGFAVETGNSKALFDIVKNNHDVSRGKFSDQCRNWVIENFNNQYNYQIYSDLYKEIYRLCNPKY